MQIKFIYILVIHILLNDFIYFKYCNCNAKLKDKIKIDGRAFGKILKKLFCLFKYVFLSYSF